MVLGKQLLVFLHKCTDLLRDRHFDSAILPDEHLTGAVGPCDATESRTAVRCFPFPAMDRREYGCDIGRP